MRSTEWHCSLLLIIMFMGGPAIASAADTSSAAPFDIAADMLKFPDWDRVALSPDGALISYAVHRKPADYAETRYVADRSYTRSVHLGSRVHVLDRRLASNAHHGSQEICPSAGNSWSPSWSPDGRTIAFLADGAGATHVWTYNFRERVCTRLSSAIVDHALGEPPVWAPDGRLIYVVLHWNQASQGSDGSNVKALEQPVVKRMTHDVSASQSDPQRSWNAGPRRSLASIEVGTGTVRTLVSSDAEPNPAEVRVSPSGRWLSYYSGIRLEGVSGRYVQDVVVVPATGGAPHVLAKSVPTLWSTREAYAWHPQRDLLAMWKDDGVWIIEFRNGEPRPPLRIAPELGPMDSKLYWFTRDGKSIVLGADPAVKRHGHNYHARTIIVAPLDGGPVTRVSIDERWQFKAVLKANDTTVWQPDGRSLTVQVREEASGRYALLRVDLSTGMQRVIRENTGGLGGAYGNNMIATSDHQDYIAAYEDLRTPLDLRQFSADFSGQARLTHLDPRLDTIKVGAVEVLETLVPLHDGSLGSVKSAVLLPPGAKRGDRIPAVLSMYPGGDLTADLNHFGGDPGREALLYTSRGFAVMFAQIRMGPEGEAQDAIKQMVDSLLPQVYRAAELGYIDIRRVALTGGSYGGYGTAAIVSQTNLFRAAIPVNGAYDLGGNYARIGDDGFPKNSAWAESGQGRMGAHPWANVLRYIENSPYYRADKILTPMLIVAGEDDSTVDSDESKRLFVALRRLNRSVELLVYPGQGHSPGSWSQAAAIDMYQRVIEFLRKHLCEPVVEAAS